MEANHALVPISYIAELEEAAFYNAPSTGSRIVGMLQLAGFFGACAGMIWTWKKAALEVQQDQHEKKMDEINSAFAKK